MSIKKIGLNINNKEVTLKALLGGRLVMGKTSLPFAVSEAEGEIQIGSSLVPSFCL
jgi:hypothetical protein